MTQLTSAAGSKDVLHRIKMWRDLVAMHRTEYRSPQILEAREFCITKWAAFHVFVALIAGISRTSLARKQILTARVGDRDRVFKSSKLAFSRHCRYNWGNSTATLAAAWDTHPATVSCPIWPHAWMG